MRNFDLNYLPDSLFDLQVWLAECTIKMMRETGLTVCVFICTDLHLSMWNMLTVRTKSFSITSYIREWIMKFFELIYIHFFSLLACKINFLLFWNSLTVWRIGLCNALWVVVYELLCRSLHFSYKLSQVYSLFLRNGSFDPAIFFKKKNTINLR